MDAEMISLGEYVKYLAALLTENDVPMLFKDEAPWHFVRSPSARNYPDISSSSIRPLA